MKIKDKALEKRHKEQLKSKYIAKLRTLLDIMPNSKVITMSKDVQKILNVKTKSVFTPYGKKKVEIVEGKEMLGVNDGRSRVSPKKLEMDDDSED